MVVLGFSGVEDQRPSGRSHPYQDRRAHSASPFAFDGERVPLQCFPLHLLGHDPAAALVMDGHLVACAAEERFTRIKHGFNLAGHTVLPRRAIEYCLREAGLTWRDVDVWSHYCRFDRSVIRRRIERVAAGLDEARRQILAREYHEAFTHRLNPEVVRTQLEHLAGLSIAPSRLLSVRHHVAHAAGAVYSAGVGHAAWLSVDGYGEEDSAAWGVAGHTGIETTATVPLPASLGVLYQIITTHLGFRSFGDEYKIMGLAAYGEPGPYAKQFERIVELGPDGTHRTPLLGKSDLSATLDDCFGPPRQPGSWGKDEANIAAALQGRLEEAALHIAVQLREQYGADALCISGGVGLNAKMNGTIVRRGLFRRVFVQPAAADDGAALGAALFAARALEHGHVDPVPHASWGPGFTEDTIADTLHRIAVDPWHRTDDVIGETAQLLARGNIVGWFQGRMEMGPRALGCRSILATPNSTVVRDRLNARVKGREAFRPFAPAVTEEWANRLFEMADRTSAPFMLVTYSVHPCARDHLAGVTHADGSARVQTVRRDTDRQFHALLERFHHVTGIPSLLNTSFNRAGEPLVCTPEDALRCYHRAQLDALVIGNFIVQPAEGEEDAT